MGWGVETPRPPYVRGGVPLPRPVSDDERSRIAELHAAGRSRNAIARELGRSPDTINRVAAAAGLTWDRSATVAATAAKTADLAARRAELAGLLLDDAFRLRERLYAPTIVYEFVKGGGERAGEFVSHLLDLPPHADARNIMTTVAIAVDKHLALVKADTDTAGASAVDQWLRALVGDAVNSATA
jgi:hypothetical protein